MDRLMRMLNLAFFNHLCMRVVLEGHMLKSIDFAEPFDTVSPRKYKVWNLEGVSKFLCETNKDSLLLPWQEYTVSPVGGIMAATSVVFVPISVSYNKGSNQFTIISRKYPTITFKARETNSKALARMLNAAVKGNYAVELISGNKGTSTLKLKDAAFQRKMFIQKLIEQQTDVKLLTFTPLNQGRKDAMKAFQEIKKHCIHSVVYKYTFPDIPVFNLNIGCEIRAHGMKNIINGIGLKCRKRWILGSCRPNGKTDEMGQQISWKWHVAILIGTETVNGITENLIIDLAISEEGPMTESEWLAALCVQGDATLFTTTSEYLSLYNNIWMCDCNNMTTRSMLEELSTKMFDNPDGYPRYDFKACTCGGSLCDMCKHNSKQI